jgi:hypothetical protein
MGVSQSTVELNERVEMAERWQERRKCKVHAYIMGEPGPSQTAVISNRDRYTEGESEGCQEKVLGEEVGYSLKFTHKSLDGAEGVLIVVEVREDSVPATLKTYLDSIKRKIQNRVPVVVFLDLIGETPFYELSSNLKPLSIHY